MRKLGLIFSMIIGLVGTTIYFMTIPNVDEEALVNLVVEAGDEAVLDDIYFNGYINDYSDFYMTNEEVYATETLSYLDRIDAPYIMDLQILQDSYPEFIDSLVHNYDVFSYQVVYGENYLTAAHFEITRENYRIEMENIQLSLLDKETNEIKTDTIQRNDELTGDSIEIIGLYESYPTIKILLSVNTWPQAHGLGTSRIIAGEYNFETKAYEERKLLEGEFSFYGSYVSRNQESQLLEYYSDETGDINYLYDFENEFFDSLERDEQIYLTDQENHLFAVANDGEETVLQSYDMLDGGGLEVVEEVPLAIDFELALNDFEYGFVAAELIGEYLYIVQSQENYDSNQEALPATMQVFNRTTGESVLSGYIGFDEEKEVNAYSGAVYSIGQVSDF